MSAYKSERMSVSFGDASILAVYSEGGDTSAGFKSPHKLNIVLAFQLNQANNEFC